MSTAALLATLQMKTGELNYYTQQQIFWARKYEDASVALSKQTNLEEKWEGAYDEGINPTKNIKFEGKTYCPEKTDSDGKTTAASCMDEATAKRYADYKAKGYDAELMEELTDKDIQYESMKTMYETLQKELDAECQALEQRVAQEAGDTKLIGGGG